jgi:hypothetical protein
MWLINTTTLNLEHFVAKPPPYAILSHRWGAEETSFQEWRDGNRDETKSGVRKLRDACAIARCDSFAYLWADTACIEKTSSTELSEAINSMFRYYKRSERCYAYLDDVIAREATDVMAFATSFGQSLWFTRGWTLQELLAPDSVIFFDVTWLGLGTKRDLAPAISLITGIDARFFSETPLEYASISERMSWISNRVTTRLEDIAYCMIGIFNINMPLLYGEGPKAFVRLQEELIKINNDQTVFAWDYLPTYSDGLTTDTGEFPSLRLQYLSDVEPDWSSQSRSTMLAPDPVCFYNSGGFMSLSFNTFDEGQETPVSILDVGLSIGLVLMEAGPMDGHMQNVFRGSLGSEYVIAFLRAVDKYTYRRACFAIKWHTNKSYSRLSDTGPLLLVHESHTKQLRLQSKFKEIFIRRANFQRLSELAIVRPYMAPSWPFKVGAWPVGNASDCITTVIDSTGWKVIDPGIIGTDHHILDPTGVILESDSRPPTGRKIVNPGVFGTNNPIPDPTGAIHLESDSSDSSNTSTKVRALLMVGKDENEQLTWTLSEDQSVEEEGLTTRHQYKYRKLGLLQCSLLAKRATHEELASQLQLGCEVERVSQPELQLRFLLSPLPTEDVSRDKIC